MKRQLGSWCPHPFLPDTPVSFQASSSKKATLTSRAPRSWWESWTPGPLKMGLEVPRPCCPGTGLRVACKD